MEISDNVCHTGSAGKIGRRVGGNIKKHSKKGFIEETYKSTEAIFRIWYYFEKGATFTSVSNLDKFINDLSTIECTDWNVYAGNGEKLQTCIDVMQKHVRYMMALKIIGEYENK